MYWCIVRVPHNTTMSRRKISFVCMNIGITKLPPGSITIIKCAFSMHVLVIYEGCMRCAFCVVGKFANLRSVLNCSCKKRLKCLRKNFMPKVSFKPTKLFLLPLLTFLINRKLGNYFTKENGCSHDYFSPFQSFQP